MRGVPFRLFRPFRPFRLFTTLLLCVLVCSVHAFHDEHVDDLQCVPCNTTTYCSGGSAFACPAHSVSSGVDASDVGDCVCLRGYNRTGDVCVLGAPPYYYIDGIAQVCPAHMQTVDQGATNATWCVCAAGYEPDPSGIGCRQCVAGSVKAGLGNATCAACEADTFAEVDGMEACVACAANASSETGATACFCDAGFVDSTGGDADGSACQACPANHYRTLDDAACVSCGTHFVSAPASDALADCQCDAGYVFDTSLLYSACQECPDGFYKDFVSVTQDDECAPCPANTSSPLASTDVLQCTCLAGFEAATDGVACAPCQPGTNKSSAGAGLCVDCPAHTFADALATLECTDCMAESTSPPGSESIDDCVCNQGNARILTPDGPQCSGCFPGQYAGVDACLNCTNGTFSTEYGATECQTCPANASSVESPHVECQCKKGYKCNSIDSEPCLDGNCEACPVNTYSDVTTSTLHECFACQANSESEEASESQDDCLCVPGFYEQSPHECEPCAGGFFSNQHNVQSCEECNDGKFSTGSATVCSDCPVNSLSYVQPHSSCQCDIGYHCAGTGPCPSGDCVACPNATFSDITGDNITCQACQEGATSNEASTLQSDCQCMAGYFTSGPSQCTACAGGEYSEALASETCQTCFGDYVYTPIENFPFDSSDDCSACELCADDQYDWEFFCTDWVDPDTGGVWESRFAYDGILPTCETYASGGNFGWLNPGPPICADENVLVERFPDYNWVWTGGKMVDNSYTDGAALACCVCGGGIRTPNPNATGCSGSTPTECNDCPANSGTLHSATAQNPNIGIKSCLCNENFYGPLGGPCTQCHTTQVRPEGRVAFDTNIANCQCIAGHEPNTTAECSACAIGSYKDAIGNTACTACPATFTTESTGTVDASACVCAPGFFYSDDGVNPVSCQPCAEGTYKSGFNKQTECTACKDNSFSSQASDSPEDCFCLPRFSGCNDWGHPNPNAYLYHANRGYFGLDPDSIVWTDRWNYKTCEGYATGGDFGWLDDKPALCANGEVLFDYGFIQTGGHYVYDFSYGGSVTDSNTHSEGAAYACCICGGGSIVPECTLCGAGEYKNETSNKGCNWCSVDTFSLAGSLSCESCPLNTSTFGEIKSPYCYCALGTAPLHNDTITGRHTCIGCDTGKFRSDYTENQCTECSRCPAEDERILQACVPTSNDVCGPCQANSNLPAGEAMRTFCNCNAGYGADELNDACVACEVGKARSTNANNSIPCQTCESGKFTSTTATIECETCSTHCAAGFYVTAECVPASDIQCTACTTCNPGFYSRSNDSSTADTTCGVSNNNGRSDTTCKLCDANYYCQDGVRYSCGPDSISAPGSDDATDCQCAPGFYNDGSGCVACELDHHCTDGFLERCPEHSFNNHPGSASVFDCQCHRRYYRNTTADGTDFDCLLCGPNDFCFNNTAFDCPDDRMVADAGSFVQSNCTCVPGFYNSEDDAACLECPRDTYCEHGLRFNCSLDRHTLEPRSTAAEDCLCRPGSRAVEGVCATCGPDTFCPGDETLEACPDHAVANAGSVTLLDCECSEGYASVSPNASALECVACAAGKFKAVVANAACEACTVCSAANDAVYEHEACRATADAVCVPCSTCSGGGQYVSSVCEDLLDATCANCSVCDYSTEYTHTPCRATAPTQDTVCAHITFDLSCPPGFYRGQHTKNSNSFCAPCTYRATPYLEYTLHEATGHGQTYDDPESCPIRCLGHSRLANVSLPVFGCVTCEDGNVLLKQFAEDPSDAECLFSCAPGYERVTVGGTDDCVLGALPASERSSFLHTVRVTDYGRYDGGSVLTVTHSNHSRFVIVVGGAAPSTCKQVRGCCYDAQWRVSELFQAGFPSTVVSDGCSREPELNHFAVRADTLRFQVPDERLEEVAGGCVWTGNATECVLTVSIIDTLLWYVASERVRIVTTRAAQHAVLGAQEYLPLSEFAVDVFLAYTTASGEHVYAVRTRMATQLPTLTVRERIVGMTHEAAFEQVLQECGRLQMQGVTMSSSDTVQLSAGVTHVGLSFWRGATRMVHAYFTLQMGTDNDMTVAAVRNMHNMSALCTAVVHEQTFAVLHTTAVSGLGRARIEEMSWVANASYPLRGELGTLTTFLVQTRSTTPARIFVRDVIAVYLRTTGAHDAVAPLVPNATVLAYGRIDFTFAFRQACRAQGADCAYDYLRTHDYLHPSNPHAAVHVLANCSAAAQESARGWLATSFGVPHDGEHVRAVCERALEQPEHAFAVFFVNTLAFVHREVWGRWHDAGMDAVRTYVWANFGAETI